MKKPAPSRVDLSGSIVTSRTAGIGALLPMAARSTERAAALTNHALARRAERRNPPEGKLARGKRNASLIRISGQRWNAARTAGCDRLTQPMV
jgi:hypothetical protein